MGCSYGSITILGVVKSSIMGMETVASLSKELGQFFDATDSAKETTSEKRRIWLKCKRHSYGTLCHIEKKC